MAFVPEVFRPDGYIAKESLRDGVYYFGRCRNSQVARWDATRQVFRYWREKFTHRYVEALRCREDEGPTIDVFDARCALSELEREDVPDEGPPIDRARLLHQFGSRVLQRREVLNLSQQELAKRAGMSNAALCKIERGYGLPSLEVAVRLAEALSTRVDALVGPTTDPVL